MCLRRCALKGGGRSESTTTMSTYCEDTLLARMMGVLAPGVMPPLPAPLPPMPPAAALAPSPPPAPLPSPPPRHSQAAEEEEEEELTLEEMARDC